MIDISIKITWMTLFILKALISDAQTHTPSGNPFNATTMNGMTFRWRFDDEFLHCEATAPTRGWVAIGFNTTDQLSGTNLIMGAVEHEFVTIDDRYIIKPGDHKSISALGGSEALTQRAGKEENGHTTLSFSIPVSVNDKFHHDLHVGKEYYVLMAFSQEDNFLHHSIMRTTIKLKL
jgi:hypothetical protein